MISLQAAVLVALSFPWTVHGFVSHQQDLHRPFTSSPLNVQADNSYLLDEFRLYTGELVDPYKVLKVDRTAERTEIRQKYINMSRRYHPDAAMQRDILPGSCNNLDEVRDQWERIKFSYEILSDKRTRKRYDRNKVISDPKAAMQRAAMEAAGNAAGSVASGIGKGLFSVGKGVFSMGVQMVTDSMDGNKKEKANKDTK